MNKIFVFFGFVVLLPVFILYGVSCTDYTDKNSCESHAKDGCGWETTCTFSCNNIKDKNSCEEQDKCQWADAANIEKSIPGSGCWKKVN